MEATGKLKLDSMHTMHWQQSGNAAGQAALIVHGGPGAGINQSQKDILDPRHYRIVEYDQRGSGQSTPAGELRNNTTQLLAHDIAQLRQHLGISRWLVIGGSWGSTLALYYAQEYPQHISGLILRGVFLCSDSEINWYLNGIPNVFPEAGRSLFGILGKSEQAKPLQAYRTRLLDPDPDIHLPAAQAWCHYEASCSALLPELTDNPALPDHQMLVLARIQAHYFNAGFFIDPDALLRNIKRIRTIPGAIIHGRYDMICPLSTADRLHRSWPEAQYQIVSNAGHAASEPGIRRALSAATEQFKQHNHNKPYGASHDRPTKVNA